MGEDYFPSTEDVRNAWWRDQCPKQDLDFDDVYNSAFDRWLADLLDSEYRKGYEDAEAARIDEEDLEY